MTTQYLEVHPANYVTFGEVLEFLEFPESDINFCLDAYSGIPMALKFTEFQKAMLDKGFVWDFLDTPNGVQKPGLDICEISEDLYIMTSY